MMNPAGTEDDADEVYNQILGDIGMGLNNQIGAGDNAIANQAPAMGQAN